MAWSLVFLTENSYSQNQPLRVCDHARETRVLLVQVLKFQEMTFAA